MKYTALNAEQLKGMLMAGAASLARHKEEINSLNVFPVPDGDTGTNMNLTMEAANREMNKDGVTTIKDVTDALSMGSLMGARGNSGVILSQIFRGFAKGLSEARSITPAVFANALQTGVETAYKAVIKPVEGTILTVAKSSARAAVRYARSGDFAVMMGHVLEEANRALANTPNMLPVLKEAGVVDAGGKGLCYILQGWLDYLEGRVSEQAELVVDSRRIPETRVDSDLEYVYCTEFIVTGDNLSEEVFRNHLAPLGDSLLVVGASGLIKVHIHTNNPGSVLEFALSQGKELQDIKIDNMRFQHNEVMSAPAEEEVQEPSQNGVIAVAAGSGLAELFKSMGADYVVMGGQTMNPSTEDILQAIDKVRARQIIILPNNGNVIMAAQQAAEVASLPVAVVPSKTIPQGFAALLNYSPDEQDLAKVAADMEAGMSGVKTGQVTFAVRDSVFEGKPIAEGNILGIADGKIVTVEDNVFATTVNLVNLMKDEDTEVITLFYGENVDQDEAEKIASHLAEAHPDCEIELHYGGQPLYFFIVAVE